MDMVLCCSLVIKGRAELLNSGAVSLCKACVMCLHTCGHCIRHASLRELKHIFILVFFFVAITRRTVAVPERRSPTWRRRCPWQSSSCGLVEKNKRRRAIWAA